MILQLPPRYQVASQLQGRFPVGTHNTTRFWSQILTTTYPAIYGSSLRQLVIKTQLIQSHQPFNWRHNFGKSICLLLKGGAVFCTDRIIFQRFRATEGIRSPYAHAHSGAVARCTRPRVPEGRHCCPGRTLLQTTPPTSCWIKDCRLYTSP